MPRVQGNRVCNHKNLTINKSYGSLHKRNVGTAKWCVVCEGWVDQMNSRKTG